MCRQCVQCRCVVCVQAGGVKRMQSGVQCKEGQNDPVCPVQPLPSHVLMFCIKGSRSDEIDRREKTL